VNPVEKDLVVVQNGSLSLAERIAAGARLWDISNRTKKAMEPLKELLRQQAKQLLPKPGATTIEGEGMTRALITIPDPALSVSRESDYAVLKNLLGDETFRELFKETTTYQPRAGAKAVIAALPPDLRNKVFEVVQEEEGTPRVSFQYGGSGISEM